MKRAEQKGFSLIELLVVVTVIGIIAAVAIPAFRKGIWAAENGSAFSAMRTIASTQVNFFSQRNRFARLTELQPMLGNSLGTTAGETVVKGSYVFELDPSTTADSDLATRYIITARRSVPGDITYKYELTQTGEIVQLLP